jgi:hypothetical protein
LVAKKYFLATHPKPNLFVLAKTNHAIVKIENPMQLLLVTQVLEKHLIQGTYPLNTNHYGHVKRGERSTLEPECARLHMEVWGANDYPSDQIERALIS